MRQTILTIILLSLIAGAGCRQAALPVRSTPLPATDVTLPLPIRPQVVPTATREGKVTSASTPVAVSGIHLTAIIGPTCPGPERPGQVCTRPYEGLFAVADRTGAEVARITTDHNGKATIDLPSGIYTITPKIEGRFPSGTPVTATVSAGQYAAVNVELDSGIR